MTYIATPDYIEKIAPTIVETLDRELSEILGSQFEVKVCHSKNLGSAIHLRIVDINPVNGIDHNSPAFSQFMLWLSGSFGEQENLSKVSWECSGLPRQLKFRKITSKKSIVDATEKLIEWFRKNQENYRDLLK